MSRAIGFRSGSARTPWTHISSSTWRMIPLEEENLVGHRFEKDMVELLRVALRAVEAPDEQFERLGVA